VCTLGALNATYLTSSYSCHFLARLRVTQNFTLFPYTTLFRSPWFFINNKIWLIIAKIGNSSNGPTTNVRAINGSSGKAVIAIANAIGEFLAKVVKLKLALSA